MNLLPLFLGLTTGPNTTEALLASLQASQNRIEAGFVGAAFLLPTLQKIGQHALALEIAAKREEPSWGFMVDQGHT